MKVEGFFRTPKMAKDTVEKLKSEGFRNAYMDINDHLTGNDGAGTNQAGTETGFSLARLTLDSGGEVIDDRSKAPLMAASPMASGMGGFEEIASVRSKVVVETDDPEKAKEIITSMDGEINSPNINVQKSLKDIKLENVKLEDL